MDLGRAINIATEGHMKQKDKYGAPYLGHVTRVMNAGKTDNEKIVGILHDIVEDTEWTLEQLLQEGFTKHIVDAIQCLSKTTDEENYDLFIERVKTNSLAVKVKIYDLIDNMDIRRMPAIENKDVDRLNKYLKAYKMLTAM